MEHIRQMSSEIGPRPTGSEAERRADGYIRDAFSSMGYDDVVAQAFPANPGRTSYNVYVEDPGSRPEWVVIVGAHYDTAAGTGSPGADDNASGIAVMLELARIFHDVDNVPTLVFTAFASEEYQESYDEDMTYNGSQYLAEHLREVGGEVVGMVNLDMVGVGDTPIVFSTLEGPRTLSDYFISFAERRNVDVEFVAGPRGAGATTNLLKPWAYPPSPWSGWRTPITIPPRTPTTVSVSTTSRRAGAWSEPFLRGLDANMCRRLQ